MLDANQFGTIHVSTENMRSGHNYNQKAISSAYDAIPLLNIFLLSQKYLSYELSSAISTTVTKILSQQD